MSKNKKLNKVLDHNSVTGLRSRKNAEKSNNLKKVHFSDDASETPPTFTAPEFCTLLQLADEMKTISSTQGPSRGLPEITKTKNLNFLRDEKLYRDLVDLVICDRESVNEVRSQSCSRLKKDPEIDINKYTKPNLQHEYFFTSYFAPDMKNQRTVFNGHSIYQDLKKWAESNQ